jgi:hypothetical protein
MVNKNWSFYEAIAENNKALDADPSRTFGDPKLPYWQWHGLRQLDECERRYQNDSFMLMYAIRICARHALPLPDWVARAYSEAYDKVHKYHARSWDEVFGKPYPKGRHLSASRKLLEKSQGVWAEITKIKEECPNRPIDEFLFEEVGEKFNIGKTKASEYYYAVEQWLADPNSDDFNFRHF